MVQFECGQLWGIRPPIILGDCGLQVDRESVCECVKCTGRALQLPSHLGIIRVAKMHPLPQSFDLAQCLREDRSKQWRTPGKAGR